MSAHNSEINTIKSRNPHLRKCFSSEGKLVSSNNKRSTYSFLSHVVYDTRFSFFFPHKKKKKKQEGEEEERKKRDNEDIVSSPINKPKGQIKTWNE